MKDWEFGFAFDVQIDKKTTFMYMMYVIIMIITCVTRKFQIVCGYLVLPPYTVLTLSWKSPFHIYKDETAYPSK